MVKAMGLAFKSNSGNKDIKRNSESIKNRRFTLSVFRNEDSQVGV
jgi:hypothetical protein